MPKVVVGMQGQYNLLCSSSVRALFLLDWTERRAKCCVLLRVRIPFILISLPHFTRCSHTSFGGIDSPFDEYVFVIPFTEQTVH